MTKELWVDATMTLATLLGGVVILLVLITLVGAAIYYVLGVVGSAIWSRLKDVYRLHQLARFLSVVHVHRGIHLTEEEFDRMMNFVIKVENSKNE